MHTLFKVSQSGVPVVSQIGSGIANVGTALGKVLSPPTPGAPPTVVNPADPNSGAGTAMQTAADKEGQQAGQGEQGNMLSGEMYGSLLFGSGGGAGVERATLLGS